MFAFLHVFFAVSVVAAIASLISDHRGLDRQRYLFKPLPVLLMIPVALSATMVPDAVRWSIALGLLFSAIGDVLLIDKRRFVFGLAAFLLAHLAYIASLWLSLSYAPRLTYLLPLTVWGGIVFWLIRDQLDDLELPVLIYISVIMLMVWLAVERYNQGQNFGSMLMLIGASAFALSDTLLALNRFRKPIRASGTYILSFYYVAQVCIAFSLVHGSF